VNLAYQKFYRPADCEPVVNGAANLVCATPEAHPIAAPFYFITFILFGTTIVLNLFIGVHQERPHQGLGNRVIAAETLPAANDDGRSGAVGVVRRRERLGGLLSYDHRDAA
jgi:hypothetical protein